jgi:hypothetical protein
VVIGTSSCHWCAGFSLRDASFCLKGGAGRTLAGHCATAEAFVKPDDRMVTRALIWIND